MPPGDESKITDAPLSQQQYLDNAVAALAALDEPAGGEDEQSGDADSATQPDESTDSTADESATAAAGAPDPKEGEAATSEAKPADPPPVAAAPPVATPPAPEADPLAELEAAIRQRAAKREDPGSSEVAQLKQQIADMQRRIDERKTNEEYESLAKLAREGRWKELAEAAGHDPLKAYEGFTKQAADGEKDAVLRRLESIEKRAEERERAEQARAEQARVESEQRQLAEIQRKSILDWIDFTAPNGAADAAYPHVRSTPEGKRVRDGLYYADRLKEAGREVTYAAVAELMEAEYSRLARAWAPKAAPAPKDPPAEDKSKRTNGATRAAEPGEPTTISSDIAAQSSGPDDRVKRPEDYFADMLKVL